MVYDWRRWWRALASCRSGDVFEPPPKRPRRSTPASKRRVTNAQRRIPACKAAAEKAQGMLVFPEVTKAAVGVGGSYGGAR